MSDAVTREREDIERAIGGKTTCELLERNARESGDMPALSWEEGGTWRTLNWREYRDRTRDVALGLDSIGIRRGDFVGIMGANRWEHVIADQGVVHTGAVPSTFYQTLSPEQIRYVAENCGAKAVILENRDYMKRVAEIRGELPNLEHIILIDDAEDFASDEQVISFDELMERGRQADSARFDELVSAIEPDDYLTLIYTSGTTGPPKGVPLTHHNMLFEVESLHRIADLEAGTAVVSYLPLAHIAERSVSIYNAQNRRIHAYFCPDPKQVLQYVQKARPHMFVGVPRVWEKVRAGVSAKLEAEENDTKRKLAERAIKVGRAVARLRDQGREPSLLMKAEHAVLDKLVLSKVREGIGLDRCEFAITSTAPMPYDVEEWFAAIGLQLNGIWGMTELSAAATCNPPEAIKIGTVGVPLPGVELKLAEEDNEVCVRGPIVIDGYLNMPEETEALIDDEGWLHSGDIGEWTDDGYLKIVDRKKELIITSSGKNISPAHVESLLKEHPLIGQALAYGDDKPYLVALLVLDPEVAPQWAEQQGIDDTDVASLSSHPKVQAVVEEAVQQANSKLARIEQIKYFTILPSEWTPESEELTPTMKLKRRVITDKYRDEIEDLYEQGKQHTGS
ncbi:MAG: long-chain fatty acid--CoA ligase [Nitriliruptorales bacterium]|nr:long-chain fatty acid--CoA ligase [Nitriliruptorales bacterium]